MSKNLELASDVLRELIARGVKEFCICPGARNAPLVSLLSTQKMGLRVYSFFEERSAAFFALGRIRRTSSPVAVVTTSGTAVGELLPAVMEAYYTQLPLVLLTADRPRRYRGSGAPQAAEQVGIFGIYAGYSFDLQEDERADLSSVIWNCPIHFNLCFDEPLLDLDSQMDSLLLGASSFSPADQLDFYFDSNSLAEVRSFFQAVQYPMVIVGMLQPKEREAVTDLLLTLQCPTYLEATSGLREEKKLAPFQIKLSDRVQERIKEGHYPWDGVIRIGGIPTLRLWRDLDLDLKAMKVLSVSSAPFTGLGRSSALFMGPIEVLARQIIREVQDGGWRLEPQSLAQWLALDQKKQVALEALLHEAVNSEPSFFHALSQQIPQESVVYVGNSLPIRQWDLAATYESQAFDLWASRGLNGIDGQVSTFLGYAHPKKENWAILGDLTALYDLPGPWILPQLKETIVNLVVINNGGGKIFSRMFEDPIFQNVHSTRFKAWADLWGLDYECWEEISQIRTGAQKSRIIEVRPDEFTTQRFWKSYQTLTR